MGLDEHVDFSTHTNGNYLDLVITEAIEDIQVLSCKQRPFISDHCIVKVVINENNENITSWTKDITIWTKEFRNYKKWIKLSFKMMWKECQ